jgi:large-conductance mechanosensitive channel
MSLQDLTFGNFLGAAVVFLLLVDIYIKISTAAKMRREEKKRKDAPVNSLEETVKDHTEKLKNDHKRLTNLEEAVRILMRSQIAQLDHEITGNSIEKLKDSKNEIQQFLIDK